MISKVSVLKILRYNVPIFGSMLLIGPPQTFSTELVYPIPQENRYKDYLNLLNSQIKTLGPIGSVQKHEIEIVTDSKVMKEIEEKTGRTVGIILKDPYWLFLNDPVKFPSGATGVFGRMISVKSLGNPITTCAVLILTDGGKIPLNRNYRHPTRSWEYELARGGIDQGETPEAAAIREVKEETGYVIENLHALGVTANESGMTNNSTAFFLAKTSTQKASAAEDTEAIEAIELFSLEEVKKGLIDGYLKPPGSSNQVALRDPFLTIALWQAQARGLLNPSKPKTKSIQRKTSK